MGFFSNFGGGASAEAPQEDRTVSPQEDNQEYDTVGAGRENLRDFLAEQRIAIAQQLGLPGDTDWEVLAKEATAVESGTNNPMAELADEGTVETEEGSDVKSI
jgi:hypothetical protein